MSKRAEEKAVEYQIKTHGPNVMGGASVLSEEEYMRFNMNLDFKNGYEQAEEDLALTIEDIELLHTFLYAIKNNKHGCFTFTRLSDEQYEEVLHRFREMTAK